MEHGTLFLDVLVFLAAAVVVVPLFQRLKLSPVLGYLASGLLVGPHGFGLVKHSDSVHALAELGVVFLLFTIGLELSLKRLVAMRRYVFGLGLSQVVLTGIICFAIARFVGLDIYASAIIGGALALSSTAFVMQLLAERGEQVTRFGRVSFSILLLQDIAVVPLIAMIDIMANPTGGSFAQEALKALGVAFVALVVVMALGRLALRPVYRIIAATKNPELFVATTLLVLLGISWVTMQAGLSMAMGAFLCGLLMSETEYRHQVEADIRPFKGILLGLFFMTVGMGIDMGVMASHWQAIGLILLGLVVGKTLIIAGLCLAFGLPRVVAVRSGLLLAQGGEFAFVLIGSAMTFGLIPATISQIILVAVTLSMVVTPGLAWLGSRISYILMHRARCDLEMDSEELAEANSHVIIAGFGRVGQTVAKTLIACNVPYVAFDLNLARVSRGRGGGFNVYYGDASRVELMKEAGAERAKALVITIDHARKADRLVTMMRQNFADLPIIVRARDMRHGHKMEAHGATAVVSDAVEASLQLGTMVLHTAGTSGDDILRVMNDFRRNDYEALDDIID